MDIYITGVPALQFDKTIDKSLWSALVETSHFHNTITPL